MITRRGGLLLGLAIGAVISLIFMTGFIAGAAFDRHQTASSLDASDPDLQNFLSAYRLVTQRSYYRPFNKHRLLYAAIDGMLNATGDPHTVFLTPPQNQQADQQLNGSRFSGIGAIVVPLADKLQVWAPEPHSPATIAGLHADDIITAVDGQPVTRIGGEEAIARIHGPAGSVVRLTVIHGHGHPVVVRVRREQIPAITAYGRLLPGHIGFVQIFSFGDRTAQQVHDALTMLAAHHVRGVVLDLRQNPGGYVDAAQAVVSDFLSRGIVAFEEQSDKTFTTLSVLPNHQIIHVPVAVLVDGQSASAAEITAAALRDNGAAILVGTRTYGKGSMQSVYALPDGSTVRITDRLWLTPRRHSVANVGLAPTLGVPPGTGNLFSNDPQLKAAERYLETRAAR